MDGPNSTVSTITDSSFTSCSAEDGNVGGAMHIRGRCHCYCYQLQFHR
jgi:hypothetical protein